MGVPGKTTRQTHRVAAKTKAANDASKDSNLNNTSKPEKEAATFKSFTLPIRDTVPTAAIEHVQAPTEHNSNVPESVLLPLIIDDASFKAYIDERLHGVWAAAGLDEVPAEELAEEASSTLANHVIFNGASKAAWQHFVDRLDGAGMNKKQKHKLFQDLKYKVLASLADGLCDPIEYVRKCSFPHYEQVIRSYYKYESELNARYLYVSEQTSTYLSKILLQSDKDAFNNSNKGATALILLRKAYDSRMWEIVEQRVYPNGEIYKHLPPGEKMLPSKAVRYLVGDEVWVPELDIHVDENAMAIDDDDVVIDGEDDKDKTADNSDDGEVIEWVWNTLECPHSVFKLLEHRARLEMSAMVSEHPFLRDVLLP